ncbi:hypothetical protein M413DRAFT_447732 [Hebeloma cylindrosporum]|uniref:Peptidase M14 domain-containing protein n=1 Tax=Hebeloma cylindrosporum TaxID=76867 RepID=A0A0C3BP98_HEBCY|nr:hypothetical protein M413DRAFT_447732 [Hebeloma cylindrosporum h7]
MAPRRLLLLVLSSILIYVSGDQQVLSAEGTKNGYLRRFGVESSVQWVFDTAKEHDLDIWHASKSFVDVYSPPEEPFLPADLAKLPHNTTAVSTTTPKHIGTNSEWNLTSLINTTFHESYHPLYEINSFINQLSNAYPNITRLVSLGHTAEGREMTALSISTGPYKPQNEGGKKKKRKKQRKTPGAKDGMKMGFVIIGAQHAREWIATATSTYLAHALVANKSEPHSISYLLDHFDFHIIPVPNPDGYSYTWETDRYWYKNRQILGPYTDCVGLDMNRNWGFKWKPNVKGGEKVTRPREPTNPCSHWYPGTRPFEAPEVNNMENWITTLPNLVGFINLRSYGQMLSSPYSYTCNRVPKDAEDQIEAALGASQKLKSIHGTDFQTGSLCSMLYAAPGNILDWMYSREAIKYSYVAHLRDTGTYGFALPAKWIRPTGEETSGLIDYLARFIAKQAKSA